MTTHSSANSIIRHGRRIVLGMALLFTATGCQTMQPGHAYPFVSLFQFEDEALTDNGLAVAKPNTIVPQNTGRDRL